MSLAEAPWWPGFVAGLKLRSLGRLAAELGVPEGDLEAELIRVDPGGPASAAPWWPEVVRLRTTVPIRALARRFGCEPRRLRRSLARYGWRAGGVELERRGVPALGAFVERLGREPDGVIAREAGVSLEAVQGERRRLRVGPFHPTAASLTPEEEAWIRGPARLVRRRHHVDEEALQVVRRPLRAGDTPLRGPGVARAPRDERPRDPSASPEVVRSRPAEATAAPEAERSPREDAPRRVGAAFFWEERGKDIERLLTPASRTRDGRQRIVRAEDRRDEPPSTAPASLRELVRPESAQRPARGGAQGTSWRRVDLGEEPTLVSPAPPIRVDARPIDRRPLPVWEPPRVVPARPAPPVVAPVPVPVVAAAPVAVPVAPATPKAVEERPLRAAPASRERTAATASTAPAVPVVPAAPEAPAARTVPALPAVRTAPPTPAAPNTPPVAAPPVAAPVEVVVSTNVAGELVRQERWEIIAGGGHPSFFVTASDITMALCVALARLGHDPDAAVAIVRAGAAVVDLELPPVAEALQVY
jgi:hypothetical protein